MKLTKDQILYISQKLCSLLKNSELVNFKSSEDVVKNNVANIIIKNIDDEIKIDLEVKKILKENEALINNSSMNYSKLFNMTKKKLAKEKGFIL